jgi:hypothetical protein
MRANALASSLFRALAHAFISTMRVSSAAYRRENQRLSSTSPPSACVRGVPHLRLRYALT